MPEQLRVSTEQGKEAALLALRYRRAHRPERIDNSTLLAGSPMYYYCISCGDVAEVLPEAHLSKPKTFCKECQALIDCGWLE
jgi:hypothetical protein